MSNQVVSLITSTIQLSYYFHIKVVFLSLSWFASALYVLIGSALVISSARLGGGRAGI